MQRKTRMHSTRSSSSRGTFPKSIQRAAGIGDPGYIFKKPHFTVPSPTEETYGSENPKHNSTEPTTRRSAVLRRGDTKRGSTGPKNPEHNSRKPTTSLATARRPKRAAGKLQFRKTRTSQKTTHGPQRCTSPSRAADRRGTSYPASGRSGNSHRGGENDSARPGFRLPARRARLSAQRRGLTRRWRVCYRIRCDGAL